jgi:hypothetical protein
MAPTPSRSREDVIAAGLALRARGEEPTQNKLWIALGKTGHPTTAFRYWTEYLASQAASATLLSSAPSATPLSPERTKAYHGVGAALDAFSAQVDREAQAPLLAQVEALTALLVATRREAADQSVVIDLQHEDITHYKEEIRRLCEEIARLHAQLAQLTAPKSSLILPPK